LSPYDFTTYLQALEVIEAQEMLRAMNVADYPTLKKESRSRLHKQVYKQAFPDQKKRVVTTEDLKKLLGSVG
jgi:hypothetical protein